MTDIKDGVVIILSPHSTTQTEDALNSSKVRGHIRPILLPPTTFLSHLQGCTSPNSPIFASFQQKCLEKYFSSPWGGAPAPSAPPGYAYALQ